MLELTGLDAAEARSCCILCRRGYRNRIRLTLDLEEIPGPHDVGISLASKRVTVVGNSPDILF
jgi:hypothetical protein